MGILEATVLPMFFIVVGLILDNKIYKSFTKDNVKRNTARVFAFILSVLTILLLYVLQNPIMSAYFRDEYPWARLVRVALVGGSLAQVDYRVLNEVKYQKSPGEDSSE